MEDRLITEFNDWIVDLKVVEPPCVGRKYTWFRPNGTTKSKLAITFVSTEWFTKWPTSTVEAIPSKIILMMPKNQESSKFQRIKSQASFKNQDQDSRIIKIKIQGSRFK